MSDHWPLLVADTLGSDAFASVADKLAAVGAEQRRWRDLAVSTDFADT